MDFISTHQEPKNISDMLALYIVKGMRRPADLFFSKR